MSALRAGVKEDGGLTFHVERQLARKGAFMNSGTADKHVQRIHIRWMIRRDMPEVIQIEQESHDYPWTEEDFLHCLRQRNCIGMVAEHGDKVVGFMIYELHKTKLHILNFAVHPSCRRARIGTQMVQKLVGKLSSHRRNCITLEVRETNLESQLFFRSVGFNATSVFREHFEDTGEDAYLMRYRYPITESAPASVDSAISREE